MISKRKILFVAQHLTIGGVQKSLIAALHSLDYEKNDVTLYIRKKRLALLPHIDKRVHVIVNDDANKYYRKPSSLILLFLAYLLKIIKLQNQAKKILHTLEHKINAQQMQFEKNKFFANGTYDIAISYFSGYTAEFVSMKVNAKKKYVFYHGSTDELHELHERIFPSFDKIIAVNTRVKNILSTLYPQVAEKIDVLENYVDYLEVRKRSRESIIAKPPAATMLCSCGRLSSVKGFDLAVQAAAILKEKKLPFVWYFVGDGPERTKLEQAIASKCLEEQIIITGMLDNPYPYMAACDIYVQPSFEESFGLTIAEAKILCRPIVSTSSIGAEEQITHLKNGILTEITGESLASGITQLIINAELLSKIINNLSTIDYSQRFETYKAQWSTLLKESD